MVQLTLLIEGLALFLHLFLLGTCCPMLADWDWACVALANSLSVIMPITAHVADMLKTVSAITYCEILYSLAMNWLGNCCPELKLKI